MGDMTMVAIMRMPQNMGSDFNIVLTRYIISGYSLPLINCKN